MKGSQRAESININWCIPIGFTLISAIHRKKGIELPMIEYTSTSYKPIAQGAKNKIPQKVK